MVRRLLFFSGLMFGLLAFGATPVEEARAEVLAHRQALNGVRRKQLSFRNELDSVAAKIEALKAKNVKSSVLKEALQKSVELSNALTRLTQEMVRLENQAVTSEKKLLIALNEEWKRLRQAFNKVSEPEQRRAMLSQLRRLRAERDQVRQSLPKEVLPDSAWAEAAEDAETLLEEADALKDREAKVRKQLKELEARIAEAKEERELARRMSDFMGDEALFDDQDRRLRLSQAETTVSSNPEGTFEAASAPSEPPVGAEVPTAPAASPPLTGSDARPVVGSKNNHRLQENDDLESLLSQKEQLKQLAEDMKARAQRLEQQARDAE